MESRKPTVQIFYVYLFLTEKNLSFDDIHII